MPEVQPSLSVLVTQEPEHETCWADAEPAASFFAETARQQLGLSGRGYTQLGKQFGWREACGYLLALLLKHMLVQQGEENTQWDLLKEQVGYLIRHL